MLARCEDLLEIRGKGIPARALVVHFGEA